MNDRHVTADEVKSIAEVNKLRPKESDFIGKRGYERKYREDGSYVWRYRFKPNDQGKLTREGAEVQELLAPFQRADTERHLANQAKLTRTKLTDGNGQEHFVEPALADRTARQNGWSHRWRAGGVLVERGPQGMFFYLIRDAWEPTGRVELGPLGRKAPRAGIQTDPDGNPWRWVAGKWRSLWRSDGKAS